MYEVEATGCGCMSLLALTMHMLPVLAMVGFLKLNTVWQKRRQTHYTSKSFRVRQ